jgi:hypothetical protein
MRVTLEELSQMAAEIACPIAYLLFSVQKGPYEPKWGPISYAASQLVRNLAPDGKAAGWL